MGNEDILPPIGTVVCYHGAVHPDEALFLPELEHPALTAHCWMSASESSPYPCLEFPVAGTTQTGLCPFHLNQLQEEDRRA